MKKEKLIFEPIDERTTEQKYQDIEKRNQKIQQELVNIMTAWNDFKKELDVIQDKYKKKDNKVYGFCLTGIAICTILLIILEWSK